MRLLILTLFSTLLVACSDSDDVTSNNSTPPQPPAFTADIAIGVGASGEQQVPRVDSSQSAGAIVEIDEDLLKIRSNLDISGIANVEAAHIHEGYVGENGAVLFAFAAGDDDDTLTLEPTDITSAQLDTLLDGGWYINVHTADFPNGEVRAQILTTDFSLLTFRLDSSQEVPAVRSSASGSAYATYNSETMDLKLTAVTNGVEDATMAHIHTGRIGENGGVLVALEQSADDPDVWMTPPDTMLLPATVDVLLSGGHYVNVHTPANPGGELRGQILTDNLVPVTFGLAGAQEVPAVNTTASGSGYALVNTDDFALELKVVTTGVEDATMAHIHTGRVGRNGGVLLALEQDATDSNVWAAPTSATLNEEIFAVLASGGHYVNVHTPANPSGELRGQITLDDFTVATFGLTGEQEVPAVNTDAEGDGYALINTETFDLELTVLTEGVDDATMAHIHTGRVGNNGGVLVALEQSMEEIGRWSTPADLAVDADILAVLLSGGHYVNVHTPANPGGELRGQILNDALALATFGLSGNQEVPAVSTSASGNGYALVNVDTFDLELTVVSEGVDDATMAHIHTGRVGENGPVLVGLEQSAQDPGRWSTPAGTAINADILAILVSGGHYVNVHTPANASGELRGQILTENFALYTFPLSGDQEVPPVTTAASGDGYALVNTDSFALELSVVTDGVDDATMAHIHTGERGVNGNVLLALEQSAEDSGRWSTPAETAIDATIFSVLDAGGHYVNVHTPANPGGELRGQIE